MPQVSSRWLSLLLLLRLLRLLLKLLLLALEKLLLLGLLLELLLLRLELLLLTLHLLPSGVKVRPLSVSLELWSLLLELLLLLNLIEPVEIVSSLASWLLLESVSLLLLLLLLLLSSKNFLLSLPLSIGCNSLCLCSFTFPHKFSLDNCCQSFQIQVEEHVKGVLLSLFGESSELSLAVLLDFRSECQIFLIEGCLLLPAKSLPWCWVCEGLETKLVVVWGRRSLQQQLW